MEFYRESVVTKPRKIYICYLCDRLITGKHLYISCKQDGEFYYDRAHFKCHKKQHARCIDCEYNDDCQVSIEQCFRDNK